MAQRKKKSASNPKRAGLVSLISAAVLFVLVLLNQAMGGRLPLPSAETLETSINSALDELYDQAGLSSVPTEAEGDLLVHFIDVGQADCELIQTPEQNVLIDAGEIGEGPAIIDYLKAQGVSRLDMVIATHPHADHIGSMAEIIDAFEIGTVLFSDVPDNLIPTTRTYERLLDAIERKNLKITLAEPRSRYDLGGGAVMTILGPLVEEPEGLNDTSVICRLDFGSTSFLFTGDAEKPNENALLKAYDSSLLRADVLKLGHHGSSTSNQEKWVDAVDPRVAVAELGKDNTYGHPHTEVVRLLEERDILLYRTDLNGTIVFGSNGETLQVTCERNQRVW